MRARMVIGGAAIIAALLRYPGLIWPLRPDEAGFLLVARGWEPERNSLYGPYFVDRPPLIIALVKALDAIGGEFFLRTMALVFVAAFVVLMALVARRIGGPRAAMWTAVVSAALVSSGEIQPDSAKGEVLALPVIALSMLMAVLALERESGTGERPPTPRDRWIAVGYAALAGVVAMSAVGLKQSMLGGLVFGGVLLIGAAISGRISWRRFGALAGAALAGAAAVVAAVVIWTIAAGVRLQALWYAVVGFRSDAGKVIASQPSTASDARALVLLQVFCTTGMVLVLIWFLINLRPVWRTRAIFAAAVLATFAVDAWTVVAGGSYWRPYLFNLVPSISLMVALVLSLPAHRSAVDHARTEPSDGGEPAGSEETSAVSGVPHAPEHAARADSGEGVPRAVRGMRLIAMLVVTATVISSISRGVLILGGVVTPAKVSVGEAIGAAAEPGDTMTVFGGRADLQLASGLESPYPFLWSLPMRTMDPELQQLRSVLLSEEAPNWFLLAVSITAWDLPHDDDLARVLRNHYVNLGTYCGIQVLVREDQPRTLRYPTCD